ncbi:MAG: hypothetical protein D6679_06675 [Candidatus Hydrogenedentota bacterium]|nr:MAG: hypothetical protein D6679_06675 [Candidatus Hydrogenedentota bacterium]
MFKFVPLFVDIKSSSGKDFRQREISNSRDTEVSTMRLYNVSRLRPGMKTALPVFGYNQLLLNADVALTGETIRRLPKWGIYHVFVQEQEAGVERSAASAEATLVNI